ncbi:MAG: pirin family protein [Myxococcales bacterium]|nr:pirin family protein [Myxococcales bacterium]
MITLRRARERRHYQKMKRETWATFDPRDRSDPLAAGFGALHLLEEDRVPPGFSIRRHPHRDVEMLTYIFRGSLEYENSLGDSGTIYAGDFRHMSAGRGVQHSETNPSPSNWSHVYRIGIRPARVGLKPSDVHRRFSVAHRSGVLCAVASNRELGASLGIQQSVSVYSALLDPGQHLVHTLAGDRCAWLHVLEGEIALGELLMTAGDGVGVQGNPTVSFTAKGRAEVLLVDLALEDDGERAPPLPT